MINSTSTLVPISHFSECLTLNMIYTFYILLIIFFIWEAEEVGVILLFIYLKRIFHKRRKLRRLPFIQRRDLYTFLALCIAGNLIEHSLGIFTFTYFQIA